MNVEHSLIKPARIALVAFLFYKFYKFFRSFGGKLFLTKILMVYPFRLVLPCVWLLIVSRWYALIYEKRARNIGDVLRLLCRRMFRVYLSLEAVNYLYYMFEKKSLEKRQPLPPWNSQILGMTRLQGFQKMLHALQDVNLSMSASLHKISPTISNGSSPMNSCRKVVSPRSSLLEEEKSIGANLFLKKSHSQGKMTVDSIIRSYETQPSKFTDDEEISMLVLKRSCFTSWFNSADLDAFKRGNIDNFLSDYFFEGRFLSELTLSEKQELKSLTDYALQFMNCSGMPEGLNPHISHISFLTGPIPAKYRPAILYFLTHSLIPKVTNILMEYFGFKKYNSGSLSYWYRKRKSSLKSIKEPLVFFHGLGLGVLPYIIFTRDWVNEFGDDRDMFFVDLPCIAMRPTTLPSSKEIVSCVSEMLQTWNCPKAVFVGHSYGTVVVSWLIKQAPQLISSLCLLDPVCFLYMKSDMAYNCLHANESSPAGVIISYWVAGELYIANTLTRSFRWFENVLYPEDLKVKTLAVLSSEDVLVPSHSIRHHLMIEVNNRNLLKNRKKLIPRKLRANEIIDHNYDEGLQEVLWLENAIHGQVLFNKQARKKVFDALKRNNIIS